MNPHSGDASSQRKAYEYLKEAIVNGAYRPNQRLKALPIANQLGISRTPVKEALGRLEQEGLVKRELGSGYVVHGLSVRGILNLYKVREVLEVEAGREALPHLGDEAIRAMRETLVQADKLFQQGRFDEFLLVNRRFHNTIAKHTQNEVLQQILSGLDAKFWSVGTVIVRRHPDRAQRIRVENRAILDAIVSRDAKAMERSIRAHVRGAARYVKLVVENEPQHLFIAAA